MLALPIFKQEESNLPPDSDNKILPFQYVLCAATSPAVKLHDETLTYLNHGQPFDSSHFNSQENKHTRYWQNCKRIFRNGIHRKSLIFKISGQSYEIRMLDNRKMGELPEITGKMVKVRQTRPSPLIRMSC